MPLELPEMQIAGLRPQKYMRVYFLVLPKHRFRVHAWTNAAHLQEFSVRRQIQNPAGGQDTWFPYELLGEFSEQKGQPRWKGETHGKWEWAGLDQHTRYQVTVLAHDIRLEQRNHLEAVIWCDDDPAHTRDYDDLQLTIWEIAE